MKTRKKSKSKSKKRTKSKRIKASDLKKMKVDKRVFLRPSGGP